MIGMSWRTFSWSFSIFASSFSAAFAFCSTFCLSSSLLFTCSKASLRQQERHC